MYGTFPDGNVRDETIDKRDKFVEDITTVSKEISQTFGQSYFNLSRDGNKWPISAKYTIKSAFRLFKEWSPISSYCENWEIT